MNDNALRYAIISADEEFRVRVRRVFRKADPMAEMVADVPAAPTSLGRGGLKQLDERRPDVIVVDVDDDPSGSIETLKWLSDQDPRRVFLLAGPPAEPAVLLEAMRAGATEYLTLPVEDPDLGATVTRALRRVQGPRGSRAPGKVIAFFGGKGGSGVTTTATNVAVWLRRSTNKPTLLLDLDLDQGSAALLLSVQPRYTLVDVVRNFHRMDDDLMATYVARHGSGLDVLVPPARLDLAHNFTREQVEALIAYLRRSYSHIVVDLPRRISPANAAVFGTADHLCLVATPEIPALRNLKRFLGVLPSVAGMAAENVQLILNRHRPERDNISRADIREVLGLDVSWTLAEDADGVLHSTNVGTPIVLNGTSPYTRDLKALCRDLTEEEIVDDGSRGGLRRAMGRLFRPFRKSEEPKQAPAPAAAEERE